MCWVCRLSTHLDFPLGTSLPAVPTQSMWSVPSPFPVLDYNRWTRDLCLAMREWYHPPGPSDWFRLDVTN